MKKALKVLKYIILIAIIIFALVVVYKYVNYYRIYIIQKNNMAKNNIKVEVNYFPYDNIYTENKRSISVKDNSFVIESETNYTEEYKKENTNIQDSLTKMYFLGGNTYTENIIIDELNKTFNFFEGIGYTTGMIPAFYPSIEEAVLFQEFPNIAQELWSLVIRFPEILQMNFYSTKDGETEAYVVEGKRYISTYPLEDDDAEYTKRRVYYNKGNMLPYKVTKAKKDGTEKTMEEYNVSLDTVTDKDIALPNLDNYVQIK